MNKLIICNWKMNGCTDLVDSFLQSISSENLIIAFPNIFVTYANSQNNKFKLAAQDCSIYKDFGAHTGEISAKMLHESGVEYVIVGHSERRASFDSIENVYKKLVNVIENNMTAILCVDENYKNLIDEKTEKLLENNIDKIILAYEPVSAIGTGVTPTIEEIRVNLKTLREKYFGIRTIYGGSVNSRNSKDLLEIKELDGLLIGGASLKLEEIQKIL